MKKMTGNHLLVMTTKYVNDSILLGVFIKAMTNPDTYRQNPVIGQGLVDFKAQSDTVLKTSKVYGHDRIRQFLRDVGGTSSYIDADRHSSRAVREAPEEDYDEKDGAASGGGSARLSLESSLEAVSNIISFHITSTEQSVTEFSTKTSYQPAQADAYAAHIISRVLELNRNLYPYVAKFVHSPHLKEIRNAMVAELYAKLAPFFEGAERLKGEAGGDLEVTEERKHLLYLLGQIITDSSSDCEAYVRRIIGCFIPGSRSRSLIIVVTTILNDYKKEGMFSEAMKAALMESSPAGRYDMISNSHIRNLLHTPTA